MNTNNFKSRENQLEIFKQLQALSLKAVEAGFEEVDVRWRHCPEGELDGVDYDVYWAIIDIKKTFRGGLETNYRFDSRIINPIPYVEQHIEGSLTAYSDFLDAEITAARRD